MTSDFAAFDRSPIPFTVGGETFRIPWRPAAEWALNLRYLPALAVRMADVEDRDWIGVLAMDMPEAASQIRAESYRILAEQTGRKWWEAARLLATSAAADILGRLTLAGADPWKLSVGQWCAATYVVCTQDADEKGRLRFDFSLAVPPEGFEDEWDDGADDPEAIAAAVAGMMG